MVDDGGSEGEKLTVRHHAEAHRFEIAIDGQIAFLQYRRTEGAIVLVHTEVPPSLRGRGLGNILAKSALDAARLEGAAVVVRCPFVRAYLEKHPDVRAGLDVTD